MSYDHRQTSSITFGGISQNVKFMEDAVSHRVAGHDHWMLKLNDIKVGMKSITPKVSLTLTDTGTSLIFLDEPDFKALINTVCEGLDCFENTEQSGVFAVKNCTPQDLPDIWLQIDRHSYRLAPQAYVVSVQQGDGSRDCQFLLRPNEAPTGFVLLGLPFLTHYFQIYDVKLNQLSLAPIRSDESFVGNDGSPITGFGEA